MRLPYHLKHYIYYHLEYSNLTTKNKPGNQPKIFPFYFSHPTITTFFSITQTNTKSLSLSLSRTHQHIHIEKAFQIRSIKQKNRKKKIFSRCCCLLFSSNSFSVFILLSLHTYGALLFQRTYVHTDCGYRDRHSLK